MVYMPIVSKSRTTSIQRHSATYYGIDQILDTQTATSSLLYVISNDHDGKEYHALSKNEVLRRINWVQNSFLFLFLWQFTQIHEKQYVQEYCGVIFRGRVLWGICKGVYRVPYGDNGIGGQVTIERREGGQGVECFCIEGKLGLTDVINRY